MNFESFENSSEHVQQFKDDIANGNQVDFGNIKPADKKRVQNLMSGITVTPKKKVESEEEEPFTSSDEEILETKKRKNATPYSSKKKSKKTFEDDNQQTLKTTNFGFSTDPIPQIVPNYNPIPITFPIFNSPAKNITSVQDFPIFNSPAKNTSFDFGQQNIQEENPRVGNYTVEYAKSGRSTCVISGQKIPNKSLRIGREEDNGYDGHTITRWMDFNHFINSQNHLSQFQQDMAKGKKIEGILNLNSQDQTRVNNLYTQRPSIQTTPVKTKIPTPSMKQPEPIFQTPEKKMTTPKKERDEFKTPKRPSPSTQPYQSYYGTPTQTFSMPIFEKLSDEEASKHLLNDLSKTELQLIIDRMIIKEPKYKQVFQTQIQTILGERIN